MRKLLVLALAITLIVPSPAMANPGFYVSPIFGVSTGAGDTLLVADAGQGIVRVTGYGPTQQASLFAPLLGITDVDPTADGGMWALRGGGGARTLGCLTAFGHGANLAGLLKSRCPASGALFHVNSRGIVKPVADLARFERLYNPHPAVVDSNPFDVQDLGGGIALVADAGGNTLELLGFGIPIELAGGSIHACTLAGACETIRTGVPILTSITFRGDGSLWGAMNALFPGAADVVELIPAP